MLANDRLRAAPLRTALVAVAAPLLTMLVVGCGTGTTTGGNLFEGGAGDGGLDESDAASDASSCAVSIPATQNLSQPCCPAWGADACGAGLFCAAFDGRTQFTCYPEHSRADGETCTENIQCVTKVCGPTQVCGAPPVVTPPPPPEKKCPSTCASSAECQNMCPVVSGAIQCCDDATGICFASKTPSCPGPG